MNTELLLKILIPLGSTLFGGFITYSLWRVKERKEIAQKQLESLFELQKINFKLLDNFNDLETSLDIYVSSPSVVEPYNQSLVTEKIKQCSSELAEVYVVTLANAVHINSETFEYAKQMHEEARRLFVNVTKSNYTYVNGELRGYTTQNLNTLQKATMKIAQLQDFLMRKESLYVERYINKYNKKL
ncbi:hypothetical protein HQK17_16350 [Bacillus cereus]|uniref:hypothetical protein n=1 Tax=Bacillus cereus TaxID=1396 RepID=UPI00156B724B|nr:hypothetical protein [Bacillus cereus]NRQ69740.1 hypothetical protein [Bacillus cereus]